MEQHKDQTWSPPPDWSLEHRLIWDLGFFGHYLHQNGGRSGKKRIITRLAQHGGCMDQRELQDSFDIKSGSLSEVLAKLEAEGLIERTKSEEDARKLVVSLTKAGKQAAEQERQDSQRFETEALEPLSTAEREELLVTLDRLINHWNTINRKGE